MKPQSILLSGIFLFLCACGDPGFDLDDPSTDEEEEENTNADPTYIGPSKAKYWELVLDDEDNDFSLVKKNSASGSTNYTLLGAYSELSSGVLKLDVTTDLSSTDIDQIYGLSLSDKSVLLFPFETNADEIIALVNSEDCPSNDLEAGWINLQSRSEIEDDAEVAYFGEFTYSSSNEDIRLSRARALDDEFEIQSSNTIESDACEDVVIELDAGDQYLSDSGLAVVEQGDDDYSRIFAFPIQDLDALSDLNGDFIGIASDQSDPSDTFIVSASCTDGSCEIFSESDAEDIVSTASVYSIEFDEDSINDFGDGLISGAISDTSVNRPINGNIACFINNDFDSASSDTLVFFACVAQAPVAEESDSRQLLNLILRSQ